MIRLAHLSDIHVSAAKLEWKIQDYLNKRFAGWINYRLLGRRHRFRFAKRVLRCLVAELQERRLDHVVFSGDATALGFESEMKTAAHLLRVDDDSMPSGLAVPGNHDYATKRAARSGFFEHYFANWQHGERIDGVQYPFAQRVGDYWLIGVNSSVANRFAWDATGWIGPNQTERFKLLLERLPPGPRILVTHYPVCLSTGKSEKRYRRLRDLRRFMDVAVEGGICLWLHGHRHRGYFLETSKQAPFPIVCAGSATQAKMWSYCEYELNGSSCKGLCRTFNRGEGKFLDAGSFEFSLPGVTV